MLDIVRMRATVLGMTNTKPLSEAQATTLRTIAANGGAMNGYAGQRSFYCNSLVPLVRAGLLEWVATCAGCTSDSAPCLNPLPPGGTRGCYHRVRITAAGRLILTEVQR